MLPRTSTNNLVITSLREETMADIRTHIAYVLREHDLDGQSLSCRSNDWTYDGDNDHYEHLADVLLSLPDIAITRRA